MRVEKSTVVAALLIASVSGLIWLTAGPARLAEYDCELVISTTNTTPRVGDKVDFVVTLSAHEDGILEIFDEDHNTYIFHTFEGDEQYPRPLVLPNRRGETIEVRIGPKQHYSETISAVLLESENREALVLNFGEMGTIQINKGAKLDLSFRLYAARHGFSDSANGVSAKRIWLQMPAG